MPCGARFGDTDDHAGAGEDGEEEEEEEAVLAYGGGGVDRFRVGGGVQGLAGACRAARAKL